MEQKQKKMSLPRGTRVITKEQLPELIRLYKLGYSYGLLALKFNVSRTSVFNYVKGKQVPYDS